MIVKSVTGQKDINMTNVLNANQTGGWEMNLKEEQDKHVNTFLSGDMPIVLMVTQDGRMLNMKTVLLLVQKVLLLTIMKWNVNIEKVVKKFTGITLLQMTDVNVHIMPICSKLLVQMNGNVSVTMSGKSMSNVMVNAENLLVTT